MIFAEGRFVDFDRPPIERLSVGILALVLKRNGEIIVIGRNGGVILA
jgi:hypothetical protein